MRSILDHRNCTIALILLTVVSVGARAQAPSSLDDALRDLVGYETGRSSQMLRVIETAVFASLDDQEARTRLETRLLAVLADEQATLEARSFVCRQLAVIGGTASIPALTDLLDDETLSHMARTALQSMPGVEARLALTGAVARLEGDLRVGVINSLAQRAEMETARVLDPAAAASTEELAAMARALARVGGEQAWSALEQIATRLERGDAAGRTLAVQVQLAVADGRAREGQTGQAADLYEEVIAAATRMHERYAAMQGLLEVRPDEGLRRLNRRREGQDPAVRAHAVRLMSQMRRSDAVALLVAHLADLARESDTAALQVDVLHALEARGDSRAGAAVATFARSPDADVRTAAVQALGAVGTGGEVTLLARLAAQREADAAESLLMLRGPGIDLAMVDAIDGVEPPVRIELARALASRRADSAAARLVPLAEAEADGPARRAMLETLGEIAGPSELSGFAQLVIDESEAEDGAAGRAFARACARLGDPESGFEALLQAAGGPELLMTPRLLIVLGLIGGERSATLVGRGLESSDR
ncbi:MAG: hypothetical protein ACYTGC_15680, partial [Planctomycetota bacterium]